MPGLAPALNPADAAASALEMLKKPGILISAAKEPFLVLILNLLPAEASSMPSALMSPLFWTTPPDLGPVWVGYLGLILFAGSILTLGNFLSTLTENQIIAAVLTFVLVLVLWFLNVFARGGSEGVQGLLGYLSPLQHLDDFQKGVLDLSHVVYFLSLGFLGIFLTYRSLESMRWRG